MVKVTKTGELTIVVSRYWPLNVIKSVDVSIDAESVYRNSIILTREQAEKLYIALGDTLNKGINKEVDDGE